MDVIEATRKLGEALQADERYKNYMAAKKINDGDNELQEKIGQFNLIRMSLDKEFSDENGDKEKIKNLNEELRAVYAEIMGTASMVAFNEAKTEFDALLDEINTIITMCANGDDPATCEPSKCTGSCETCGGCH